MIFLFRKTSIVVFFIAKMMRIFKWKVLVTTNNKSYLFRKTEVFFSGLYSEDILYTHASMLDNIEIETVNGDYEKISDKCVDNLYDNIYKLDSLHRFFPNIEDLSKKIKLSVPANQSCGLIPAHLSN